MSNIISMERVKGLQPTEYLGKIMLQFLVWFYGNLFIYTG